MKDLRNKNQKGFTLIELLVVIAIIGLLASVVLLALNSARSKSRDAKRIADIRQVTSAFELYFNDKSTYPTQALPGAALGVIGTGLANYITPTPSSPTPADGTCGLTGVGSNEYYMLGNGTAVVATYTITFCLGGQTGTYIGGIHTVTQSGIQ